MYSWYHIFPTNKKPTQRIDHYIGVMLHSIMAMAWHDSLSCFQWLRQETLKTCSLSGVDGEVDTVLL